MTTAKQPYIPRPSDYRPYGGAKAFLYDRSPVVGISGPAGTGKALPLDTPIPTPDGWVTMDDLVIGDVVFDETGSFTNVTAISDVMYNHDCFKITTDDNVEIVADADHEWTVFDVSNRNWKTLTTRQIKDTLVFGKAQRTRWAIPTAAPVQYEHKELEIDPYILGVWLGDGSKRDASITCYDLDIIHNIIACGYDVTETPSGYGTHFCIKTLQAHLTQQGLKNNKHIPQEYMLSSIYQRLSLIQGLMDTDGCADARQGICNFTNKNKQLVFDLTSILWSLGVKVTPHPKITKMKRDDGSVYECEVWQINFTTSLQVFRLPRKMQLQQRNVRSTQSLRYIKSVEQVESVPVKCIKVDSPLSLYLAGLQYVVTHNSRLAVEKAHLLMEKYPGSRYLFLRKTRESLSEAALFTYENKVLPPQHPCLDGPKRSHRQVYYYPNGSEIHVVGLDKPQKVMSTEYDGAYIQEAIECEESDVEMVTTRLRNGIIPYQQLIFDCNPDKPKHFIKLGADRGLWPLYESHHEDNPTLWVEAPKDVSFPTEEWPSIAPDGRIGRWTEAGISYIAKLDALTGARRQRLRKGLWVAAEGAVFDVPEEAWYTPIQKWPDTEGVPPHSWRRLWSVDFGYVHPFVLGKFAQDEDGTLWQYWEFYHTKTMVKDAAKIALNASGWEMIDGEVVSICPNPEPLPTDIVCDHDAEGRATLEDALGIRTTAAYKGISDGIEAVATRLKPRSNGRPGIMLARSCVHSIDTELRDAKKPISSQEEWDGYVWDEKSGRRKGELPLDADNHGMDMHRYLVNLADGIRHDFKAKDVASGVSASIPIVAIQRKEPDRRMGGMLIGGRR